MVEAEHKLNTRQQAFAEAYAIPGTETYGNAYKSALKAGYKETYAKSQSSALLENVGISEYIRGVREKLFDENIMDGKEVLYRLSRTADGSNVELSPVVAKRAEYVENPNNPGKFTLVYNEYIEIAKSPPKISDQNKALELLGKHHKLWTEKTEVEHSGAVQFVDDIE